MACHKIYEVSLKLSKTEKGVNITIFNKSAERLSSSLIPDFGEWLKSTVKYGKLLAKTDYKAYN